MAYHHATFAMTDQLRILLTGFEPFGGAARNPSGDAARSLHGKIIRNARIEGRILPVVWNEAPRLLHAWLQELKPHVAISLGMARDRIEIETRATNRRHPDRRDNSGALPIPPRAIATEFLPTTLPVGAILNILPNATASSDTGGFLCEEVFYALMLAQSQILAESQWPLRRAGFVHVPNDRNISTEIQQSDLENQILQIIEVTIADLIEEP